MGAGIAIIAVVGLVVAIGFIWWNSSSQPATKKTTTPLTSGATQPANTMTQTRGGTVYTNQQYGFQLTFPTGWEKYTTEALSEPSDVVATIAFNLPTDDPRWIKSGSKTSMVFSLSIIPISKFAAEEAKCEKELGKSSDMCFTISNKVGQNNQYAFYYLRADKSTDYPKDFSVTLFNQVDDIIKTFKAVSTINSNPSEQVNGNKKYTNQAYGYSFDYPASWIIDTSDSLNIALNSPESQKLIDEAKKKGPGEILD